MSYRVYFGRLPENLPQDDFEKMLSEHGKPKNIEWKSGYAYVDYKHGSDAANTVQKMNGKELEGNNILVELARNGGGGYSVAGGFSTAGKPLPRPIRTPYRVRIENLSTRAKWMELKELLSIAGEVTFADTHKRKQGEGIVEFGSKKDMREAISMFDRTIFFGKTIRLYDESLSIDYKNRNSRSRSRSPPRRRPSPGSRERRRKSRSRSTDRKRSDRKPEPSRRIRSKSPSPRRKSDKHKRSKSPSASPNRRSSRKHRSRSVSPNQSSRSHKKPRKSRSKSPKRNKKHEKSKKTKKRRKSSSSSSSNDDSDLKRKSKSVHKKGNSSSDSDSSSSSASESDHK